MPGYLYLTAFLQLLELSEKVVGNGIHKLETMIHRFSSGSQKEEDGDENSKRFEIELCSKEYPNGFEMPLHYPKLKKEDFQKMEEWKLDMILREYGVRLKGDLDQKRAFAIGAFLWPDQL
ncbi:hypothetical protein L6164_029500 [Bauhinia variegata]|uniref:Uncharacterized protein n=1 Tax=Bauhinia variegata TaxID=167791 RepID=A0ACB9L8V7_BAUVA|nr:hypothetical protein L6164_029500 [Bauhinia variegata]